MTMAYYLDCIAVADALWELDEIVEDAAFDDDLSHGEYCDIYDAARLKVEYL